jgi:hypothetical protein
MVGAFWCTNEPQANTDSQDSPRPELRGSHHLSPYSILCACPRDQYPNVILSLGVPKFPQLGLPQLWGPITLCANLWLKWSFKKCCSACRDLSNDMWHATWTQGNRGDSWFSVVKSQNGNLTPNPSFGHNLCFKCPNGSCKPIFDIQVPRAFQWYKELLNQMGFDPYNRCLKIQESIETPTPEMGVHLGVWGFIPSLSYTLLWWSPKIPMKVGPSIVGLPPHVRNCTNVSPSKPCDPIWRIPKFLDGLNCESKCGVNGRRRN